MIPMGTKLVFQARELFPVYLAAWWVERLAYEYGEEKAIEAIYDAENSTWNLHKGQDLTFIDSTTPSASAVGILGGNFQSYIPEGGYVLLAGSALGGI